MDLYFQQVAHNEIYPTTDNVYGEARLYEEFLKIFDTTIKLVSYLHVPTVIYVLHQLEVIMLVSKKYLPNERYFDAVSVIKENFDKYFDPLPLIFGIAIIKRK